MRFVTAFIATTLILTASTSAMAEDTPRLIAVTGTGEIAVSPDRAIVTMGIDARNLVLDQARDQVNQTTRKVLKLAQDLGIDDKYVSTTGANINPEYRYDNNRSVRRLTGYRVFRNVSIDLRDLDKLGRLVEGAVDLGINQVSPPSMTLVDRSAAEDDALKAAAKDARRKAELLAETLGVKVGPVHSLTAVSNNFRPAPMAEAAMMRSASADAGGADTYSAGEVVVTAQVNAQFTITD